MSAERLKGSWPAEPASVGEARAAVAGFASAVGIGPDGLMAIMLAVSEAVTNTVVHAYVDDARPGQVHVTAEREPGGLRIAVADQGCGLRPRTDSPGSGLGLPLIAQMAERFHVERGDEGGTTLHMRFPLGQPFRRPAG